MKNRVVNEYQQNQVMHTSLGKLIVLLYEGAITFTAQAQEGLRNQDPISAGVKLLRARNIVSELRNGLDYEQGGELAENLERLYDYAHDELLRAGREGSPALLDPVIEVLTTLKEAWQQVNQSSVEKPPVETPPRRPQYTPSIPIGNDVQEKKSGLSIKV